MGLTDDISTLMRKELELAKAELQENIKEGAQAGGMMAAGGMLAYAGLLFILAAVAIALGQWWENYWLATAVVGLVAGIVGWAILNGGMKQLKEVSLVPRKALASLERDAKMAKEKLT
jgi:drug/metabolite transporter (DMT)-like permease